MRKEVLKGYANALRGKIREKWGKLTDDDVARFQGKAEQLLGALEIKYGLSREKIEHEINEFLNNFDREYFREHWEEIQNRIKEKFNSLTEEDINRIKGKRDEIVRLLEEKYKINHNNAIEKLREFLLNLKIEAAATSGHHKR